VVFDGALEIGLDVVGAGSRAIARGSRFMGHSGVPVHVGEGAFVTLRQNLFRAAQGTTGPAVACASAQDVALDANVFMHFGRTPVAAAAGPAVIVDPAYTILPPVAPRGRPR
jgi:hypothetical protein